MIQWLICWQIDGLMDGWIDKMILQWLKKERSGEMDGIDNQCKTFQLGTEDAAVLH